MKTKKNKTYTTTAPRTVVAPENYSDAVKQEIQQNRDRGLVKDEDEIVVEQGSGAALVMVNKPNGWSEWTFAYD